jgi:hypothetical protein
MTAGERLDVPSFGVVRTMGVTHSFVGVDPLCLILRFLTKRVLHGTSLLTLHAEMCSREGICHLRLAWIALVCALKGGTTALSVARVVLVVLVPNRHA